MDLKINFSVKFCSRYTNPEACAIKNHEKKRNMMYILAGDFNARILKEEGLDARCFGKHFLKTDREIPEINADVWDNRERFVDFAQENLLAVKNTLFNKNNKRLCTYLNKNSGH